MVNTFLILLILLIILYLYFSYRSSNISENFSELDNYYNNKYSFEEIYDDFYIFLYDDLFFNQEYYVILCKILLKYINHVFNNHLCIGIKHGGHLNELLKNNMKTTSISKSKAVIEKCKYNYKDNDYKYINRYDENPYIFDENTFTHISIIDNELYYTNNIEGLFNNCYKWLIFKGYLFIQTYKSKSDLKSEFFKINENSNTRINYNYTNTFKDVGNNQSMYLIETLKNKDKKRTNNHQLNFYDENYLDSILRGLKFEYISKKNITNYETILIYQKV